MKRIAGLPELLAGLLALFLASLPPAAMATEEPVHEVVRKLDDGIEIRRYAPYLVAQVLLLGSADEAGKNAFPILAGYIFGKIEGARQTDMTEPVTRRGRLSGSR